MWSVSTFDLIAPAAASDSLVAFCFFNLIIAILLVGSSWPSSNVARDQQALPGIADKKDQDIKDDGFDSCKSLNVMIAEQKRVSPLAESSFVNEAEINDDGEEGPDDNQNKEDDELRRRVEEFIDKVNRGWRVEQLRMQASCR